MAVDSLEIEYVRTRDLKENSHNARTHSKRQVTQIAASIKAFGFTNPVLVDKDNVIVAGHGRVSAARKLGMPTVPTVRLENLTPDEIRAYMLADNKLATLAGWDSSILAIELQHLTLIETDFDITTTGFEIPEIDVVLTEPGKEADPDDTFELPTSAEPVTRSGDLWELGKHRLLCGNSLQLESLSMLMGKKRATLVFTDPPYNVAINGNVCGKGSIRHQEFQMAAGEMSEFEFISFLTGALSNLSKFSTAESVHYVCMDWRHAGELLAAGKQAYDSLLNICVWVKNNGGMGSLYRSKHELVFVFRNGRGRHRNNVQLGRFSRNRTNVWEYPCINTLSKQTDEGNLLALHPTVKPVALVADALFDCSARGDLVLDSFLGSGSTLMAAERTGRHCYGIELEPRYVDTAIRRWQRHTGDQAVHVKTGKRFNELLAEKSESHG